MINSILVPATGSAADDIVFTSALTVARACSAHLDFLHVRIDAMAAAVAMSSDGGGALVGVLVERLEAEAEEHETQARERFARFCEREKLAVGDESAASWHLAKGEEPDCVVDFARTADLVVIGRPRGADGVARETLEATLLESGRPLLLPGTAALTALPETVAMAWKPTREAAHAVTAAMPFLHHAKQAVVLTVAEGEEDGDAAAARLATGLRRHGLPVAVHRLAPGAGGAGPALVEAAREHRAMLAMGGYGHSRLREWIFGGVTQHVLTGADVPVLIAH